MRNSITAFCQLKRMTNNQPDQRWTFFRFRLTVKSVYRSKTGCQVYQWKTWPTSMGRSFQRSEKANRWFCHAKENWIARTQSCMIWSDVISLTAHQYVWHSFFGYLRKQKGVIIHNYVLSSTTVMTETLVSYCDLTRLVRELRGKNPKNKTGMERIRIKSSFEKKQKTRKSLRQLTESTEKCGYI